jgi:hypothetical protein
MTIYMKNFGKNLITRQAAKSLLNQVQVYETPVLDFAGVDVANHPFLDELGKGIATLLPNEKLCSVKIANSNPYIDNCVAAGFASATAATA